MKQLVRLSIVILLILLVFLLGARWYLRSSHLVEQVRSRLEQSLGGPVKIAEIDTGFGGTNLQGLELYESPEAGQSAPWLKVERVEADVSVLGGLSGQVMPGKLSLT